MTNDLENLKNSAALLKENAKSLARAASYMGLAAKEVGSIAVPLANRALTKQVNKAGAAVGAALSSTSKLSGAMTKLATASESQVKRALIGGAAVAAITAVIAFAATSVCARKRRAQLEAEEELAE